VYPVFGALIGAWFGVIPLALDWDRPWQVRQHYPRLSLTWIADHFILQTWPLPPVLTSIIGFIFGGLASFMHSIAVEAVEASKAAVTTQAEEERAERERADEKSKRKKRKGGKTA
jgi:phosphatidylinositol glycan class F